MIARSALAVAAFAIVMAAVTYCALAPVGAVSPAAASTPTLAATSFSTDSPTAAPSDSPSSTPSATPTATPTPTPTATPTPPPALKLVSVSPRAKAANVSFARAVIVVFSRQLAADTPHPTLSPTVPGAWKLDGKTFEFVPKGHLPIYTRVHLTVPGGATGVRAADGGVLKRTLTSWFAVGGPSSVARLQQLLAELGYLPLKFRVPVVKQVSGVAKKVRVLALSREPRRSDLVSLKPLKGTFSWRFHHHIPQALRVLWSRGKSTVLIRGAIMAFESDHNLADDGVAGRNVWIALLQATARHRASTRPYRYLEVSTALPETLKVWQNGRVVYQSLCNTGIAQRPTALGTYPVYARYVSTTMSGTNPDGSHYSDPGVPYVAYFNGGDAVHGFVRGSYGYPQSLGCVELPYSAAAVVFKYDPIGTLVAVS